MFNLAKRKALKHGFQDTPPELAPDIIGHGIIMTVRTSQVRNFPELRKITHLRGSHRHDDAVADNVWRELRWRVLKAVLECLSFCEIEHGVPGGRSG